MFFIEVFLFRSSQNNSKCCGGMVNPLFQRDWRWLRPSKQSFKTQECRNPTRKSCRRTLNTRMETLMCITVCCMQSLLPHLGQSTQLERRMCFQKAQPVWNFMNVNVFVVIIKSPQSCRYPHTVITVDDMMWTNLTSTEHAAVTLLLVVGNWRIKNRGPGQEGSTDWLMDLRHTVCVCLWTWTDINMCLCVLQAACWTSWRTERDEGWSCLTWWTWQHRYIQYIEFYLQSTSVCRALCSVSVTWK